MKIRVTMLTENNEPIEKLGDNPELKVRLAWEMICDMISRGSGDKATLEKVEIVREDES